MVLHHHHGCTFFQSCKSTWAFCGDITLTSLSLSVSDFMWLDFLPQKDFFFVSKVQVRRLTLESRDEDLASSLKCHYTKQRTNLLECLNLLSTIVQRSKKRALEMSKNVIALFKWTDAFSVLSFLSSPDLTIGRLMAWISTPFRRRQWATIEKMTGGIPDPRKL